MNLKARQRDIATFAEERDWDQFHTPRNLAASIAIEAAELLELFQWTEAPSDTAAVIEEAADVMIFLLRFCDVMGIDIEDAVFVKMNVNRKKYPVHISKGNAVKYSRRSAPTADPSSH